MLANRRMRQCPLTGTFRLQACFLQRQAGANGVWEICI